MVFIYTLKLQSNKYYVGKTNDPNFRLTNHFDSCGSSWTKKYNPISIQGVIPDKTEHDEQRITQEYMHKYAIENVRGGPWCKIKLSDSEIKCIEQIISSVKDKCYNCGSTDHFSNKCSKKHLLLNNVINNVQLYAVWSSRSQYREMLREY